ncbi:MAG: HD domain-containing protein [Proteobacteria bacterium]|nr:HD domain-containing protein [Pseudomonadota bacterium]
MTEFYEFALTERFDKAFCLASRLHRTQKRKNIHTPFMCHLMSVCALVTENIGFICNDPNDAEDFVITAILHDTIEDQGGQETYNLLKKEFGEKIADYVMMLSDSIPVNGIKPPKAERNEIYKAKLRKAPLGIVLISCCDKIHNLRSMSADALLLKDEIWEAYSEPPANTVNNYKALGDIYRNRLQGQRIIEIYDQVLRQIDGILPA